MTQLRVFSGRCAAVALAIVLQATVFVAASGALDGAGLVRQAHAVVGRPATPGSVAGVRRRTRRRTAVVAGSAGYAAGYSTGSSTSTTVDTTTTSSSDIVYALPGGCGPLTNGIHNCAGVYYKPYYQGDEVIYRIVTQP